MNEELLPCPFCGGKNLQYDLSCEDDIGLAYIACEECKNMGPLSGFSHRTRETAKQAAALRWNYRVGALMKENREHPSRMFVQAVLGRSLTVRRTGAALDLLFDTPEDAAEVHELLRCAIGSTKNMGV